MNLCRECKQPAPRGRKYCGELCGRMYAQRAYKTRKGLISVRPCPAPYRCPAACPADACGQCHNTHPARPCAMAHSVRLRGHTRQRRVVPADCRACGHGT
jgi:hypothetical protein